MVILFSNSSRTYTRLDKRHIHEVSYKTLIDGFVYDHLGFMKREEKIRYAVPPTLELLLENQGYASKSNNVFAKKENLKLICGIPPVIKNIDPGMSEEKYKLLKHDLAFLKLSTTVCDECVVAIGKSKEGHLLKHYSQANDNNFVGTGKLEPERTRARFRVKN